MRYTGNNMTLRFHEIAEANHRIQNPLSEEKLIRLGYICGLNRGTRVLDLACGKGELLCRWAEQFGIKGTGVDISAVFLDAAQQRARELNVWSEVNFVQADAAEYPQPFHQYDIVSCIGATWIGGGLIGTLNIMRQALKDETSGLFIIGDIFWQSAPNAAVRSALGLADDAISDLGSLPDLFQQARLELVHMLIATRDEFDHYYASQWMTVYQWLRDHPQDPDAPAIREWMGRSQRSYLKYERDYLGWGVFVLRPMEVL